MNGASSNLILRAFASSIWYITPLLKGQWWPLSLWAWLKCGSLPSHYICYEDDNCQHALEKEMICVHVKYSSPSKATGYMQTIWMLLLKDTPSRPQKVSISSNFKETEKLRKMRRRRTWRWRRWSCLNWKSKKKPWGKNLMKKKQFTS